MSIYDDIVDAYIRDLSAVRDEVLEWWERLLAEAAPDGDRAAAERIVRPRWPAGPVSHPRVIAVFRHYYLLIDDLNDGLAATRTGATDRDEEAWWGERDDEEDDDGITQPRFLLLDSLEARDAVLAEFMTRFVFVPIGANPADDTA